MSIPLHKIRQIAILSNMVRILFLGEITGRPGITAIRKGLPELKKKYSIDSTMEELLNHPDIRAFLSQMMEVDMIPDIAYGLSLRDVAKIFAGEIKKDEAQMLDMALAKF